VLFGPTGGITSESGAFGTSRLGTADGMDGMLGTAGGIVGAVGFGISNPAAGMTGV
jgi:hypothetical protein